MTSVTPMTPDEILERYRQATIRHHDAEIDVYDASNARALALLELAESGMTLRDIALKVGMSHVRVAQLIARARAARDAT